MAKRQREILAPGDSVDVNQPGMQIAPPNSMMRTMPQSMSPVPAITPTKRGAKNIKGGKANAEAQVTPPKRTRRTSTKAK